jgi:hypothetical protein
LKLEYNVTNHGLRRLSNEEIKKSRKVLRNFEEYEELR